MLFKTLIFASVATVAVAQTATSSSTSSSATGTCGSGQIILDSCMSTIQAQVNACEPNDYNCLCSAYTSMVQCYGNAGCSAEAGVSTAQQFRSLNCANASAYGTTSTQPTATATSTSASGTSSLATAAASGFASGSSTGSSASASTSSSTNGAESVKNTGGLLTLLAAGIAALL